MSRPDILDEKCHVCGRVIYAAPKWEGHHVDGKDYCDRCYKKTKASE